MQTKTIITSILAIAIFAGVAVLLSTSGGNVKNDNQQVAGNVSLVGGKQIITINAKGGYMPRITTAKAGIPTVINVKTQGTFDCSSSITIPSLGYQNNLPPSGETAIDVPAQTAGTILRGLCSMGMYNFSINFN